MQFNKEKRAFFTIDKSPVFTTPEFLTFFEKVALLEKTFILDNAHYFPIDVAGEPLFCLMLTCDNPDENSLNLEKIIEINQICSLIRNISSMGARAFNQTDHKEVLGRNRSIVFGEIAGGVLHDLNNVMGAILGRAQLAMMKYKRNQEPKDLSDSLIVIET